MWRRGAAIRGVLTGLTLCAVLVRPPGSAAQVGAAAPSPTATRRPNFIVINLDDTRADGIDRMPVVQSRLVAEGVSFSRSFVPNSVCAPSRASLLTGLYSSHHGTRAVSGTLGGADTFRVSGADRQTIAVWLHDAGYMTGLFGKYVNDYQGSEETAGPGGTFYVPPGWDRWRAMTGGESYGGVAGQTYRIVDEQRRVTKYDKHGDDLQYSTDVLVQWVREFVADAVAADRPFFVYWAPFASHGDPTYPVPARRHTDAFKSLPPWRPPNWSEADIRDKPHWVQGLTANFMPALTDAIRVLAYQSLLAVDEGLATLLQQLEVLGIADRTVIILTSDNGSAWGEHRVFAQFKECPYEECIRVPMVVRDPRAATAPKTCDAAVLNIDVAPTLAALAGVAIPVPVDGLRFDGWMRGGFEPARRTDVLLEHFQMDRGASLTYREQVSDGDQIRLLFGDTSPRPRATQLFEFDSDGVVTAGAVPVPIGSSKHLSFFNLGVAVTAAAVPNATLVHNQDLNELYLCDRSPNGRDMFWWVARDQAEVVREGGWVSVPPDYVGVRDVAHNYTYVEYVTGEVELYDLAKDPWELENKVSDPAYAVVRAELADRLKALRQSGR
jgi:arylsulfatase A-like enzyme